MSAFQNGSIVQSLSSTVTSGGTTTLTASSRQYQVFTGTSNQTVKLPDATTMKNGMVFTVVNGSTGTLTVNYNDNSQATTIDAGKAKDFALFDNSSSNGSFDITVNSAAGGGASQSDLNTLRAGQLASNSQTSKSVFFNPEEIGGNFWLQRASMGTGQDRNGGFTLNYFPYNIGGQGNSLIVERFDDTNNYWLVRASVPSGQGGQSGCFDLDGFGFSAGGSTAGTTQTSKYTDSTNAWSSATALPSARSDCPMSTLNGLGYMAGGSDAQNGSVFATNYAYSASSNTWYIRAAMTTPHYIHKVATLNNYVYSFGGQTTGPSTTATGERYNDVNNSWLSIKNTNVSNSHTGGFSTLGFLYTYQGATDVEQYYDTANVWVTKAPSISDHTDSKGMDCNGYGFGIGGTGTNSRNDRYSASNMYNITGVLKRSTAVPTNIYVMAKINELSFSVPAQIRTDGDSWKTVSANEQASVLKTSEALSTKFLHDGALYVTGGDTPSFGTPTAVHELYNENANNWISRTSMNVARGENPAASNIEGYGIIYGGTDSGPTNSLATSERYDEIGNSWLNRASGPAAKGLGMGHNLLGKFHAVGGRSGITAGSTVDTNYQYTNLTDSWLTKAAMPAARSEIAGYVLGETAYAVSGCDTGAGGNNNNYQYNPISDAWTSRAVTPNSDRQCSGFSIDGFGYRASGVLVSSTAVHKYNPSTDSWSSAASLAGSHTNGGGARSHSYGYIYCEQPNAIVEQYNAGANTWTTKGSLNTSRRGPSSHSTPGVYRNYELRVALPALFESFGGATWTARTSLPTARSGVYTMNVNGFLYVAGGYNGGALSSTFKYNAEAGSWVSGSTLTVADSSAGNSGQSLEGFGYGPGGASGGATTAVRKLDGSTEVWSTGTAINRAHLSHGTFSLNGYLYISGGDGAGGFGAFHDQFNPSTNSWSAKTNMNQSKDQNPSESLNGFGYNCGGYNGGGSLTIAERYNDATDSWLNVGAHSATRRGSGTAHMFGKIFIFGGYDSASTFNATMESYNDVTNTWSFGQSKATNAYGMGGATLNNTVFAISGDTGGPLTAGVDQLIPTLRNLVMNVAVDVS